MELKNVIKSLVQQCNIEAITAKDLAGELAKMYEEVEKLEKNLKRTEDKYEENCKKLNLSEERLSKYQKDYVEPVEELKHKKSEFNALVFKFEVEKVYMKREVEIYKEIMASLVAKHSPHSSYSSYNSTGGNESWSSGMNVEKPRLPGDPAFK